jgi:hypothetical protein
MRKFFVHSEDSAEKSSQASDNILNVNATVQDNNQPQVQGQQLNTEKEPIAKERRFMINKEQ